MYALKAFQAANIFLKNIQRLVLSLSQKAEFFNSDILCKKKKPGMTLSCVTDNVLRLGHNQIQQWYLYYFLKIH